MSAVAVLTEEQVNAIVDKAVSKALAARMPDKADVLTREQVAEILQVCTVQVVKFAKNDGLRGIKIGREWRFRRVDVDAWLESQSTKGGK